MGLVIFILEIYEFILYRNLEPQFLGARHYLNGMFNNPNEKNGKELKVMAGFYDDIESVHNESALYNSRKSLLKTNNSQFMTDNKQIMLTAAA